MCPSQADLPVVAGTDGVGRLPDGRRVFFFMPTRPWGSMAEFATVRREFCVSVPDGLDDISAAALANPVMSAWTALTRRAHLVKGETVLINGATGNAGKVAARIARHLGASRVIATGRHEPTLEQLRTSGVADATVSLMKPRDVLVADLQSTLKENHVSVVLDYVWGEPSEAIFEALLNNAEDMHISAEKGTKRFVQVGYMANHSIHLPAAALRALDIHVMGSGMGSVRTDQLLEDIQQALAIAGDLGLSVDTDVEPMSSGESAWLKDTNRKRLVLVNDMH